MLHNAPMRRLAVLALVGSAACGDNLLPDGVPLAPAAELVVVAHQDDDLLFMQPDVLEAVRRGEGVTSVYVTAGNGRRGTDKADERYEGLMQAYSEAADARFWTCGFIDLAGRWAQHCKLDDRTLSLVFLGYPDGGREGQLPSSLLRLWEGTIDGAETVAQRTSFYDRDALIETVAQVMRETRPRVVRTLDVAATHGRDHSDHMLVGALTVLAMARANSRADLVSYRGYNVADEPPNKLPAIYDAVFEILARYEACATDCGTCGQACTTIDTPHMLWLQRRYAIGFRAYAAGRLRSGNVCLGDDLALTSCSAAPSWRLDEAGQLRTGDRCLLVEPTGDLALADCLGGRERRFFLDDEGHLFSGVPPRPEPDLDYAHLWCLAPTDTGVHMQICGGDRAPAWELAPRTTETPRSTLLLTATGREVRLGDLTGDGFADLCAIESGLYCAPVDGTGGFAPAIRIDDAGTPLAIDPKSLVLGDVDGDGRVDACGRDADGILCATAAGSFAATRWSPSFGDLSAHAGTSASLAAVDMNADGNADICGADMHGVVCAPRGMTLQPIVRSPWPAPTAVIWPADLDGDRQADWCAATDTGPACGVEAQRELTTDGAPWGYSQAGMADVAPANTATVALADIDGDGRADLCSPREDRILCARSQGRGFGPRTATLAILPSQSAASALWLGDLNGDGRADACADTGTSIACAVEP